MTPQKAKLPKSGMIAISLVAALVAGPATAQSQSEINKLKSEVETLKKGQDEIRKDLAELKKMLQRPQAQAFQPMELSFAGAPYRGEPHAPVTLVEFSDYQCPYCAQYATDTLPQIAKDYVDTGKLRYVFRELPIEQRHPLAGKAAEAALCAADQGKYWEMHETLFRNQNRFRPEDLKAHAQAIGLAAAPFADCLDGGKKAEAVREDRKAGMQAGVRGTPTFFLGLTQADNPNKILATEVIRGASPYSEFQQTIERLLSKANKGPAGTAPAAKR